MNRVFAAGVEKGFFTCKALISFIQMSPCYLADRIPLIKKGIESHFQGDYITSIHILIPQIEEALRNILRISGQPTTITKFYGNNSSQYRVLDDILRDNFIINILGLNIIFYMRVILTDNRGMNLRNDVCHGLLSPEHFNKSTSLRVIQILLLIGLIQLKEEES